MTKKDNLYSEVVINESPFYYDDHGRLRVHVLNEAQYISTADMRMDPVTGKKGPSKTIKISNDIPQQQTFARNPSGTQFNQSPPQTITKIGDFKSTPEMMKSVADMKAQVASSANATGSGIQNKPMIMRMDPVTDKVGRQLPGVKVGDAAPVRDMPFMKRPNPIKGMPYSRPGVKVGSGRNTNIRTGLRGVRPAARAMQKSAPATDYLNEKMNLKTAKMGDVIKDFQKSDASQFEGKSKAKRRIMAIAAKLGAERMSERD